MLMGISGEKPVLIGALLISLAANAIEKSRD